MISAKNGRGSIHDSLLEGHWNADDTTIPENMSSRKSILFTFLIFIYLFLLRKHLALLARNGKNQLFLFNDYIHCESKT